MKKNKYGNVYEIKLANDKYIYACWIQFCSLGIFDYYSSNPTTLEHLLSLDFLLFKDCKESQIKKAIKENVFVYVGFNDLEAQGFVLPNLANYMSLMKDMYIEASRVMKPDGNPYTVSHEEYMAALKKGYIYGFWDSYENLIEWLQQNIEDYPNNQGIPE